MVPIGRVTFRVYPLEPEIFVISVETGTLVTDEQLVTVIGLQLSIETPFPEAVAVAVIT